jgi:putative hemolysin
LPGFFCIENCATAWRNKKLIPEIILLIILIALNAYFAASEIALISLNDNKIHVMAEEGNRKAIQLTELLSEPSRFLATIQIGITLAGFLASAFAAESFADPLVSWLMEFSLPVSATALKGVTVVLITIVLSYFTLVFGELVPKRVAMKKSEGIAFRVVGPLTLLSKVASPFVRLLTISTNFFVKLFGVNPNDSDDDVTEEEIRMMIDVGEEKGTIHGHEKEMINNVFEFNNKTVEDIMIHRVDIQAISVEKELTEVVEFIQRVRYSKVPVFDGNIDNIVGILHIRDLLPLVGKTPSKTFRLAEYIRTPIYFPIMKKTDDAFRIMQQGASKMAVVVDEYGGTAGVITLEDLVEVVFGDIFDEHDDQSAIRKINQNTYEVNGSVTLEDLEEELGIILPKGDYETINGYAINRIGQIPEPSNNTEILEGDIVLRVIRVIEKRIEKFLLMIQPEQVLEKKHKEHK